MINTVHICMYVCMYLLYDIVTMYIQDRNTARCDQAEDLSARDRTVAAVECNKQLIREAFQKLTNTTSWKEAQEAYMEYTKKLRPESVPGVGLQGRTSWGVYDEYTHMHSWKCDPKVMNLSQKNYSSTRSVIDLWISLDNRPCHKNILYILTHKEISTILRKSHQR